MENNNDVERTRARPREGALEIRRFAVPARHPRAGFSRSTAVNLTRMHQIRVASTRHWSAGKSLIRREPIFDSGETNCAYAPEFAFFAFQLLQASSNRQTKTRAS